MKFDVQRCIQRFFRCINEIIISCYRNLLEIFRTFKYSSLLCHNKSWCFFICNKLSTMKKSRWNYLNLLSVSLKIQFCTVHHLKKNNRLSVPLKVSLCTLDPLKKSSRIRPDLKNLLDSCKSGTLITRYFSVPPKSRNIDESTGKYRFLIFTPFHLLSLCL